MAWCGFNFWTSGRDPQMLAGWYPSQKKIQSPCLVIKFFTVFTFTEVLNNQIKFIFIYWALKLRKGVIFIVWNIENNLLCSVNNSYNQGNKKYYCRSFGTLRNFSFFLFLNLYTENINTTSNFWLVPIRQEKLQFQFKPLCVDERIMYCLYFVCDHSGLGLL